MPKTYFHHTERLIVRPFQYRDSNHFFLLLTHPLVNSSLGATRFLSNPHMVQQFLEQVSSESNTSKSWLLYSIFDADEGQLIGGCGLKLVLNHNNAEIFYLLFPEYWGKGLAVEACRSLLDKAFLHQYGLKDIYALIMPENIRALRVTKKLGFRYLEMINLSRYGQKRKVQKWILNLI